MSINLPLAKDTCEVLQKQPPRTDNFGLLFNKYVYSWGTDWSLKTEKNDFLRYAQKVAVSLTPKREFGFLCSRQEAICEDMKNSGWHASHFRLSTQTRLIVGLGATHVLETGMTFHCLYGFPYLPASGLKGLTRAYAVASQTPFDELYEIFGSEDKDPVYAETNRRGQVVFLDGLPVRFPRIDLDIMNPHFSDYYQEKKPPADYLSPVPILFAAVAPEEAFSFGLYSRNGDYLKKAMEWLVGGLTELGFGGKTNVGYGYFRKQLATEPVKKTYEADIMEPEERAPAIAPSILQWPNAHLVYDPGKQMIIASYEGKKAQWKGYKVEEIPEAVVAKLFGKKKESKANVEVKKEGNFLTIVKIEDIVSQR